MHDDVNERLDDADRSQRRPWVWMIMLAGVFYVAHPHNLRESNDFLHEARAGDGSEDDRAATNAAAVAEGSTARRFSLSFLGIASLVCLARVKRPGFRINGWLGFCSICFLALIMLSPLWADSSFLALRRVVAVGLLVLAALAVARRFSMEDLLLFIVLASGGFLAMGLAMEVVLGNFRPWSGVYRFCGSMHPNRQGMNCALLALASAAYVAVAPQRRRLLLTVAAIAFAFLILTRSRTSLASACCGFAAFAVLWLPAERTVRYTAGLVMLAAMALGAGALLAGAQVDEGLSGVLLLGRESEEGGSSTLTGRIPLWEECAEYVVASPWVGYGYKSFWTPHRIQTISYHQGWSIMAAHNGYLEMALNIGLIGTALFVLIILLAISSAVRIARETKQVGAAFAAAVLVWLGTNTVLESWIDEPLLPAFVSLTLLTSLAVSATPLWERRPSVIADVEDEAKNVLLRTTGNSSAYHSPQALPPGALTDWSRRTAR